MKLPQISVPYLADAIRCTVLAVPSPSRQNRHATELQRYLNAHGYVIVSQTKVEELEKRPLPSAVNSWR